MTPIAKTPVAPCTYHRKNIVNPCCSRPSTNSLMTGLLAQMESEPNLKDLQRNVTKSRLRWMFMSSRINSRAPPIHCMLPFPSSSCRCLELLDRLPQLYPQHRKVTCIGYAAHCPRACPPAVSCRGPTCSSHHLQPWLVECSQQWTQPARGRGRPTEKEANRQGQS